MRGGLRRCDSGGFLPSGRLCGWCGGEGCDGSLVDGGGGAVCGAIEDLGFELFDELDDGEGGVGAVFDLGDVLAGDAEALGELWTCDAHPGAQCGDAEGEGVFLALDGLFFRHGGSGGRGGGRGGFFFGLHEAIESRDGFRRETCQPCGGCGSGVWLRHVHGELFQIGGSFEFFDQLKYGPGRGEAAFFHDADVAAADAEPAGELGLGDAELLTQGLAASWKADELFFGDRRVWHRSGR